MSDNEMLESIEKHKIWQAGFDAGVKAGSESTHPGWTPCADRNNINGFERKLDYGNRGLRAGRRRGMKQRANVTADELCRVCKTRDARCDRFENMPECEFNDMCGGRWPAFWNLTDPPRFNEQQMAFWKQWVVWGARYATENKDFPHIIEFMRDGGVSVGKVFHYDTLTGISLNKDETLDLAELLGKDGAK